MNFLGQTHPKVLEATVGHTRPQAAEAARQTRPQAARAAVGPAPQHQHLLREHINFFRISIFASSLIFAACGSFLLLLLRFAWDFNVSLTCELIKKTTNFFALNMFFSFRFALFCFEVCFYLKRKIKKRKEAEKYFYYFASKIEMHRNV
jgi:hypothetical protein